MRIRKAKLSDWPEYYRLFRLIYKDSHQRLLSGFLQELSSLTKDHKKHAKEEFRKSIFSKNQALFLAQEGDQVVGLIGGSIVKFPKYYASNREGFIDWIFVLKKFRGKGTATELKKELFGWFKEKKLKFVGLEVLEKNSHAQKIYDKWGFKTLSRKMKFKLK